jgi:hypothetical protein
MYLLLFHAFREIIYLVSHGELRNLHSNVCGVTVGMALHCSIL